MTKATAPLLCSHCGQPVTGLRFGVRMRPVWLSIIDAIVRAGPTGISRADLERVVYGDRSVSRQLIAVHVNHINDALAATDVRIRCGPGRYSTYRIVTETMRVA